MKKLLIAGGLALSFALPALPARADQPRMREALEALRFARNKLVNAEANKGGHRERAIELVDQAIHQCEDGIRFAEGK